MEQVKGTLEQDAEDILKFIASNGLVENPPKITLLVMNKKDKEIIKVGGKSARQNS